MRQQIPAPPAQDQQDDDNAPDSQDDGDNGGDSGAEAGQPSGQAPQTTPQPPTAAAGEPDWSVILHLRQTAIPILEMIAAQNQAAQQGLSRNVASAQGLASAAASEKPEQPDWGTSLAEGIKAGQDAKDDDDDDDDDEKKPAAPTSNPMTSQAFDDLQNALGIHTLASQNDGSTGLGYTSQDVPVDEGAKDADQQIPGIDVQPTQLPTIVPTTTPQEALGAPDTTAPANASPVQPIQPQLAPALVASSPSTVIWPGPGPANPVLFPNGTAVPQAPWAGGDPKNGESANPEDNWQANYIRNARYVKPGVDPASYNTQLTPQQEAQFEQWVTTNPAAKASYDIASIGNNVSDYDMRGLWLAAQNPNDPNYALATKGSQIDPADGRAHWPDLWKTPLHASFSNQSQWAAPNAPSWVDVPGGAQLVDANKNVLMNDIAPNRPDPITGVDAPTLIANAQMTNGVKNAYAQGLSSLPAAQPPSPVQTGPVPDTWQQFQDALGPVAHVATDSTPTNATKLPDGTPIPSSPHPDDALGVGAPVAAPVATPRTVPAGSNQPPVATPKNPPVAIPSPTPITDPDINTTPIPISFYKQNPSGYIAALRAWAQQQPIPETKGDYDATEPVPPDPALYGPGKGDDHDYDQYNADVRQWLSGQPDGR